MAIMKTRLKGAQKGHSLLKKKADALTLRFRMILKKIIEVFMRQLVNLWSETKPDYHVKIQIL
jgi:vacuolar-type H+-ATPase subunit D/Vma8